MLPKTYMQNSDWNAYCYDIDYDSFVFTRCESKYNDFYNSVSDYFPLYPSIDSWDSKSLERVLDDYGYMLARKDDKFYKLATDGTVMEIPGVSCKENEIVTYDDNYAIYCTYNDFYEVTGIFCIDLNTMEDIKLSIDAKNAIFRAYIDGKLFVVANDSEEYGIVNNTMIVCDVGSNKSSVILNEKYVPGYDFYFNASNDSFFFSEIISEKANLYMGRVTDDNTLQKKDLGIVIAENDIYNYGEIKCISSTRTCPFCGITVQQTYAEYLVPSAEKVGNSEKIGEKLFKYAEKVEEENSWRTTEDIYVNKDHCTHIDSGIEPFYLNSTVDEKIDEVGIIDDKYFYENYEGYWYGGGAHGMPYQGQHIFDMTTGKELGFKDFYKGSEGDFKKLIAEKIDKQYEGFDRYDAAYECANPQNIRFAEGGIVYYFDPYEVGSFAEGFIEVPVSYEELLGRKTLAE